MMNIRSRISGLAFRTVLAVVKRSEVGRYEDIIVADLRGESVHFQNRLLAALRLLHASDPRRFRRVQRHIHYIVNKALAQPGAEYHYSMRSCYIDFEEPDATDDLELSVGWHARTLVHEATHGAVEARGIPYNPEFWGRIERLCVVEENRFVARLERSGFKNAAQLRHDFDETRWEWAWSSTRGQHASSLFKRLFRRVRQG